jgi:hypothetical protein
MQWPELPDVRGDLQALVDFGDPTNWIEFSCSRVCDSRSFHTALMTASCLVSDSNADGGRAFEKFNANTRQCSQMA